jgi:hypothetical protein
MTNEKTSLSWQLSQLKQRFDEWWELNTQKMGDNIPNVDLFSWLNNYLIESIIKTIFWLTLTGLLIWIALKITRLIESYITNLNNRNNPTIIQERKQETVILSVNKWLKRADYFQQQGNYRDAIWCLYMAMLQNLNDSNIAPHQESRTDGEYLKIIQQLPNYLDYQTLLINHQKILFGNKEATINMWEESLQAYRKI